MSGRYVQEEAEDFADLGERCLADVAERLSQACRRDGPDVLTLRGGGPVQAVVRVGVDPDLRPEVPQGRGERDDLDHGRRAIEQRLRGDDDCRVPVSGLPADRRPEVHSDDGISVPNDPFGTVALLAAADAAAPTPCPADRRAAACHTVLLVTHLHDRGPTALAAGSARLAGQPYLTATIGLDDQGRPAFADVTLEAVGFGRPYSRLGSRTTFTAYPDAAPPPVRLPDPATVAPFADIQF